MGNTFLFQYLYAGDIEFGLAKEGSRNSLVLFIDNSNLFPHGGVNPLGKSVFPDGEEEFFRQRPRHRNHGQFSFPGLDQPSFMGKFLDKAGPFTSGIAPVKGKPDICGKPSDNNDKKGYKPQDNFLLHLHSPNDSVIATWE